MIKIKRTVTITNEGLLKIIKRKQFSYSIAKSQTKW